MNNNNNPKPLSSFLKDETGNTEGYYIEIRWNTPDEQINKFVEPLRSAFKFLKAKAVEEHNKGVVVEDIHPITKFFPDWESYGRTVIIGDSQQSFYSELSLLSNGMVRDFSDPEKLADLLSQAGMEIVYKAWCTAQRDTDQDKFRYYLECNDWNWRSMPVTKENETIHGNIDQLVSTQIAVCQTQHDPDTYILILGDHGYLEMVQALVAAGKRVILMVAGHMAKDEMKEACTTFIPIEPNLYNLYMKDRPLASQAWWHKFKHDPSRLSFLTEDERNVMMVEYQEYLANGGKPSDFSTKRVIPSPSPSIDRPSSNYDGYDQHRRNSKAKPRPRLSRVSA